MTLSTPSLASLHRVAGRVRTTGVDIDGGVAATDDGGGRGGRWNVNRRGDAGLRPPPRENGAA
jgi:hypothetical protein